MSWCLKLGPLLNLIFVSDLKDSSTNLLDPVMFVDDQFILHEKKY